MKKFFTLLWLTLIAFTFNAGAQQTNCNAEFSWQFINNYTVKFTPVITDSPVVHHQWNFGDGTPVSPAVSPTHTYAVPGTYQVIHTIIRFSPNGVPLCTGTLTRTIVIQPECTLVANFSWNATASNPLKIEYHNLSTPLAATDSVRWTFGDGNSVSGLQGNPAIANPVHTYLQPGTYNVCLIVRKNNNAPGTNPCIRYICKTVIVQAPCNLVADFSWTVTPNNPLRVEFHNLSVPLAPTDSTIWNFGDGTSSFDVNPVHTYTHAGTYTVCLIVKKHPSTTSAPCVRYICKTIIVPPPCNLVVNFSSEPDTAHPLRIKFTNLSAPVIASDSVRWTFGDGTSVSGLQGDPNVANPTHNYTQAGNYVVCLRIKKNINTSPVPCVKEFCKTIVVYQPCNFQVNFSWQPDQINPKKIYFNNLTVSPTATASATWYFGDGTTATTWNAVHEYAQPGRYYVCLKVSAGPNCIRYKCDSILVHAPLPPCTNQSNFSFLSTSTNSQTFTFIPVFQNASAQYTWTFGDGTGSHDMIATHHYAQPGIYTACLTVWRSATCASTTCKEIRVVPQINCDSVHVSYSYQRDPQVPNKIYFYANSNVPIMDQTWTITRLPAGSPVITLHQNNPTYLFQDTGYYRVCLRAITLGGCIKEYCKTIRIEQVSNACLLQAYPNPATSLVNVNVTLLQPEMIHAYVFNSQNMLVREKHQQGISGNNMVTININDLPAGLYTIKLIYGNKTCYARFQKL